MSPVHRVLLIYYVDGSLPEGISMDYLVLVSTIFRRKGWIEPCDTHPYYRATRSGLLEFLHSD